LPPHPSPWPQRRWPRCLPGLPRPFPSPPSGAFNAPPPSRATSSSHRNRPTRTSPLAINGGRPLRSRHRFHAASPSSPPAYTSRAALPHHHAPLPSPPPSPEPHHRRSATRHRKPPAPIYFSGASPSSSSTR
jgi:hypothetical protein